MSITALSSQQLQTLVCTGQARRFSQARQVPCRRCVEFRDGRTKHWALLGQHDPIPTTWDEAERLTQHSSVCLDGRPPRSWDIVAVVERPGGAL